MDDLDHIAEEETITVEDRPLIAKSYSDLRAGSYYPSLLHFCWCRVSQHLQCYCNHGVALRQLRANGEGGKGQVDVDEVGQA